MDKISEILNSIKERVSNPLIFSFLVSWLIINWEIPIALLWYEKSKFSDTNTVFKFINSITSRKGSLFNPVLYSILYTFIIRNLIKAANTFTSKWGETLNFNISKDGKVSMDKYLLLRNEYIIKIKELENIISEESNLKIENLSLKDFNSKLEKEKTDIYIKATESTFNSFLDGKWKIVKGNQFLDSDVKIFRFSEGNCFVDNNFDRTFYVSNFINDWKNTTIYFLLKFDLESGFNQQKFYYFNLRYDSTLESLEGSVNLNNIKLIKQKI